MSARAEWITIAGDADAWRSLGLTLDADGTIPLLGTSLRIAPPGDDVSVGVRSWALSGADVDAGSIDGLRTELVEAAGPSYAAHASGASSLDHVVVLTPDLERTSAAIAEATGHELRRIRDVGSMRQGFHRIGERGHGGLIVELVERPDVEPGPARFWGVVLIVDDLDTSCALIGSDRISAPKDAVQPGRRIATVRAEVGLGVPLALMTA